MEITNSKIKKLTIGTIVACGVLAIILIVVFYWNQLKPWEGENLVVHHELLGTYGDIVGGVIGVILSGLAAILAYIAFTSQQQLTKASDTLQQTEAKLSRFNSLFFELLKLFQEQRNDLNSQLPPNSISKNFFDTQQKSLYNQYVPTISYGQSVAKAGRTYRAFYLLNTGDFAHIFRTLYRLIDLIDHAQIVADQQVRYVKIVRAQLRESELFFLRYNAMIDYGKNFQEYINKYRLLKHLPTMSLMEFKSFRTKIESAKIKVDPLNLFTHKIWKALLKETKTRQSIESISCSEIELHTCRRYRFIAKWQEPTKCSFILTINRNQRNNDPIMVPFRVFSDIDHYNFMKSLLKEIFDYSNFQIYNKKSNLYYDNPSIEIDTTAQTTIITASISSDKPLILIYKDWKKLNTTISG